MVVAKVDLPQPDSPTIAKISFFAMRCQHRQQRQNNHLQYGNRRVNL